MCDSGEIHTCFGTLLLSLEASNTGLDDFALLLHLRDIDHGQHIAGLHIITNVNLQLFEVARGSRFDLGLEVRDAQ